MRDLLIRYLLGELDDAQQRQLEQRLQQSPELRRELDYLRSCFSEGGETAAPGNPPRGLAERTADQVSNLPDDVDDAAELSRPAPAVEPPVAAASWSLADISVAAGVFLAVGMLLLPALRGSRDNSRRIGCENNQRQLGYYFVRYSIDHAKFFPRVRPSDNAGIFAARLVDEGYVSADHLKTLLICRASKQGDDVAAGRLIIAIPTVDVLKTASPAETERLVRQMAFSYAYRFGYVDRNKYHCYRNRPPACEPVLADAARIVGGVPQVVNHDGHGTNVLFADGHVKFLRILSVAGVNDPMFLNDDNEAAAGQGPFDVVLGAPGSTPRVQVPEDTNAN